jgi:hypothetical protein
MSKKDILSLPVTDSKQSEQIFNPYLSTINTNPLNLLSRLKPSVYEVNPITGIATFRHKSIILYIHDFKNLPTKALSHTAIYLLQALIMEFNATGRTSKIIKFHIKKYMELRGLSDKKAAIEQIKKDLDLLHRYIITYQNKKIKSKKKCDQNFFDINLCQGKGINGQYILFHLSDFFYEYLTDAYIMFVHPDAFKLDPKTSSFPLVFCIYAHFNMNYGKKNAHIISVRTLLEACPKIPTKERAYPQLLQRIIEPFERDMEALKFCIKWEYCNPLGVILTDDQCNNWNYDTWIEFSIKFEIVGHPLKDAVRPKRTNKAKKASSKSLTN